MSYSTVHQIAAETGLPKSWILTEAAAGRLPTIQAGRRTMFDLHATKQAIAARANEGNATMIAPAPANAAPATGVFTVELAASAAGVSVLEIMRAIATGALPASKIGNTYRITAAAFGPWIEKGAPGIEIPPHTRDGELGWFRLDEHTHKAGALADQVGALLADALPENPPAQDEVEITNPGQAVRTLVAKPVTAIGPNVRNSDPPRLPSLGVLYAVHRIRGGVHQVLRDRGKAGNLGDLYASRDLYTAAVDAAVAEFKAGIFYSVTRTYPVAGDPDNPRQVRYFMRNSRLFTDATIRQAVALAF